MPGESAVTESAAVRSAELRWRDHNMARQQQILDAALLVLDRATSFRDITIKDIAREADLAKSVVYRRFDGRDDLLAQMRTRVTDQYYDDIVGRIDLERDSIIEILTQTISAIAVFIRDHPRWIELARDGPRYGDLTGVDALCSLKQRLATRSQKLLDQIAQASGIDSAVFQPIPAAAAAMVYGLLQDWLGDPLPVRSLNDVVSDLTALTWHLVDGAARSAGLNADPHLKVSELPARNRGARRVAQGGDR